jgi:NAD(P)-dependent dehydrogenase (short-subunit alcohol dehydrogenase family)
MILDGKTVIVSGVGAGLGSEIARCAHRDGANVMLAARTAGNLEATAKQLSPSGERVGWCSTDITEAAQCEALAAAAVERFGSLDAVVNVAALDTLFGGLVDSTPEDWRRSFEVNVDGTMTLLRAVVPALCKSGGGSIVLIGSQASVLPRVMQMAYSAAKGALTAAMKSLATEFGADKIRVNTVVPTWMWGPPVEGFVNAQAKERGVAVEEVIGEITANMPLGEIPADDDVAEAVVFFCSDRARMITGQSLYVNAGEYMP